MVTRTTRSLTRDLTRSGWELAPQRTRRARPMALALLLACVAAYAASRADLEMLDGWRGGAPLSAQLQPQQQPQPQPQPQPQADAAAHAGSLQQLEQAQLALGLAQARGRALEREIAAMNERLRTSHEELTFFRSAGRGKN